MKFRGTFSERQGTLTLLWVIAILPDRSVQKPLNLRAGSPLRSRGKLESAPRTPTPRARARRAEIEPALHPKRDPRCETHAVRLTVHRSANDTDGVSPDRTGGRDPGLLSLMPFPTSGPFDSTRSSPRAARSDETADASLPCA